MKLSHLALAAVAVALSTPALAAPADVIKTVTGQTESPFADFTGETTNSTFLNLTAGTYTFNLLTSGTTTTFGNIYGLIRSYNATTHVAIATLASANIYKTTASSLASNSSPTFTITDSTNVVYAMLTGASVSDGTASYTATLSKAVAVPGPEAGVGAGALAMAGIAMYMKRRRKDDNLAA